MKTSSFIILILLILIFSQFIFDATEQFATSPGTMFQLLAKGRQDQYLTGLPEVPDGIQTRSPIRIERGKTRRMPENYIGWIPGKIDNRRI